MTCSAVPENHLLVNKVVLTAIKCGFLYPGMLIGVPMVNFGQFLKLMISISGQGYWENIFPEI